MQPLIHNIGVYGKGNWLWSTYCFLPFFNRTIQCSCSFLNIYIYFFSCVFVVVYFAVVSVEDFIESELSD